MSGKHYKIGVCLYPVCTTLDFLGSVELLSALSPKTLAKMDMKVEGPVSLEFIFLSHTLDPIEPMSGPKLVPEKTYDDPSLDELNVILLPGGNGQLVYARILLLTDD
jgi:hypothetical protein